MGDMGDTFNTMKAESKERRGNNRENSAYYLASCNLKFQNKNAGAHLIVQCPGHREIDFWPGTGLWIPRDDNFRGYGVKNLVNYILQHKVSTRNWTDKHIVIAENGDYVAYDEAGLEHGRFEDQESAHNSLVEYEKTL